MNLYKIILKSAVKLYTFREGKLGKVYWHFPKQTKSEFEDDNFFVEVK